VVWNEDVERKKNVAGGLEEDHPSGFFNRTSFKIYKNKKKEFHTTITEEYKQQPSQSKITFVMS
jgi:hypothetical protein